MGSKQTQKAGDNSTLLQVEKLIIGVDEKRAREICDEKFALQKQEYTDEAIIVAADRVREFENRLIPRIIAIEKGLEAFTDPAFQFLLVEAQKSAASTERTVDYDLLSELLVNRIQNGEDRKTRAAISRAVEIVEEISDDALIGLTIAHSISRFMPLFGDIQKGLNLLDNLFGGIISGVLPIGSDWLDHLDVLGAIRINSFGNLKKIQEYYPKQLEGYVAVGIKKNSENYNEAIRILLEAGLSLDTLIEHSLNSDYVRIDIPYESVIDTMVGANVIMKNNILQMANQPLSEAQRKAMHSVYHLYQKDEMVEKQNIQKFMAEWNARPNLRTLQVWWDSIPSSFVITSIGRVLAHANAQRCDSSLPHLF